MHVFKLVSTYTYYERRDTAFGQDSELTGNVLQRTRTQRIVAPNEGMARAWFEHCFSPRGCNGTLISVDMEAQIEKIIRV